MVYKPKYYMNANRQVRKVRYIGPQLKLFDDEYDSRMADWNPYPGYLRRFLAPPVVTDTS